MLNGVVQSVNDANERSRQTLEPYQSLWLAHWKRADCDAAGDTISPNCSGSEELDCMSKKDGLTMGLEASARSANKLGKIKKRTLEVGDADEVQVLIPELAQNLERNKTVHSRTGIPWSGCHSLEEDISDNHPKFTRTSSRKDSLFSLNPMQEKFVEPYKFDLEVDKFDKGKSATSVGSLLIRSADMRMVVHEQSSGRKLGAPSQSDSSSDECFLERNPCGHSLLTINWGWLMEIQKSSGIRLFPSQSNSSEEYETTKSHNDCYSQLKLQKCVHGLGTMRICTAMDVSGRTLAGFPGFSETNNDLFITKNIDANTLKESDTFRRVFTKINGNMSGDLHSVPFFGQNNRKLQLQSRSCLDDIRDVKASMVTTGNELSAAADKMSMASFMDNASKRNLQSASNSNASAKTFNMVSTEVVPSREVGYGRRNNKLHGVNLKPGAASSSVKMCPPSSRSHSLENEKLVERVKQPKVRYNSSVEEFPIADAGNRWVKRLKLSSLNSSIQAMKSSDFSSTASHERRSELFNGVPNSSSTINSKPNVVKHHEKSLVSDDKGKALLLSSDWIRRWRHIKNKEISCEEGDICEPESSKLEVEKLDETQFPSIAAMAMMAKALTCFQQFELQKKGSYTVWNTKTP